MMLVTGAAICQEPVIELSRDQNYWEREPISIFSSARYFFLLYFLQGVGGGVEGKYVYYNHLEQIFKNRPVVLNGDWDTGKLGATLAWELEGPGPTQTNDIRCSSGEAWHSDILQSP